MAGDRAAVLSEARAALADGHVLEAVGLLEDRLAHASDPDALRLLGEARHRLGDLGGAGAVWFATNAKGPIIDEAIEAWRTEYDDDFAAMWDSLPAGVRNGPLNPRLAALRARAGVPDGDVMRDPSLAEPARQARFEPEIPDTVATEPEPAFEREVPEPHTPPRPRRSAATDVEPLRPESATGSKGGTSHAGTHAPNAAREQGGGFDAAKVIAWILAALFVVCAVVGLITILQWIVPG